MAAKLATVDDHIFARVEEAGFVRDGSISSRSPGDKPQVGIMQFDCGYLSPYFVTDPERMEVAFENVYILIHEKTISSKNDLLPLLEQITQTGKPLLHNRRGCWTARRWLPSSLTSCVARCKLLPSEHPAPEIIARVCCRTLLSSPAARPSPKTSVSS